MSDNPWADVLRTVLDLSKRDGSAGLVVRQMPNGGIDVNVMERGQFTVDADAVFFLR